LDGLIRHGANVVGVLGLAEESSQGVSGYARLDAVAHENSIPYRDFTAINDEGLVSLVSTWAPCFLFVVGLSQIVRSPLLAVPEIGCIGFHPTRLPEGRGRAPIAWLVLEGRPGAATLFLMDEGADSGPIISQRGFPVSDDATAGQVIEIMDGAIDEAVADFMTQIEEGLLRLNHQDATKATWYGKRTPEDGRIDWAAPASEICALIRAASHPHPGAFTYCAGRVLTVWGAAPVDWPGSGVVGRIVSYDEGAWVVQAGEGAVRLVDIEFPGPAEATPMRVGTKLGFDPEMEVFELRNRVQKLEAVVERLRALLENGSLEA
jgi:methionyl-tRNA formyltransferase